MNVILQKMLAFKYHSAPHSWGAGRAGPHFHDNRPALLSECLGSAMHLRSLHPITPRHRPISSRTSPSSSALPQRLRASEIRTWFSSSTGLRPSTPRHRNDKILFTECIYRNSENFHVTYFHAINFCCNL